MAHLPEMLILIVVAAAILRVGDPFRDYMIHTAQQDDQLPVHVYGNIEDAVATTTATVSPHMGKQLYINGVGMTSLWSGCKLMAHLPLSLTDQPRDALVVCLGMGTAFRSATRHKNLNVTCVELDPAVVTFFPFFHHDAAAILAQPNARIVVDDGRNYLAMHQQKYDLITIDPAPPIYAAGTVNLYCREFCELCRDHRKPSGCVCLWGPPSAGDEIMMVVKTFVGTFPHVLMFRGVGIAGFFCIGSLDKKVNVAQRVVAGLSDPVAQRDLSEWDHEYDDPRKVMGLLVCDETFLREILARVPVIDDDHPYTEFPLWREMLLPRHGKDIFNAEDFQRIQVAAYYRKAALMETRGDWAAALELARQTIATSPNLAVPYVHLANIELRLGHRDVALRELREAQRLDSTDKWIPTAIQRIESGASPTPIDGQPGNLSQPAMVPGFRGSGGSGGFGGFGHHALSSAGWVNGAPMLDPRAADQGCVVAGWTAGAKCPWAAWALASESRYSGLPGSSWRAFCK